MNCVRLGVLYLMALGTIQIRGNDLCGVLWGWSSSSSFIIGRVGMIGFTIQVLGNILTWERTMSMQEFDF